MTGPEPEPRRLAIDRLRVRLAAAIAPQVPDEPQEPLDPASYDDWLTSYFGESLGRLETVSEDSGDDLRRFAELPATVWTLLLSREYSAYPNIRASLPLMPEPELQLRWTGTSGLELLREAEAFYSHVNSQLRRFATTGREHPRILDYGCGWGRLTRFFARDVGPANLYGCDPVEEILEVCRRCRVPARLERSDYVPERLPFEESFDLVFAYSVFTHLSESAHERCLHAIHAALEPGGLFIVTVRPPAYLHRSELIRPALEELGPDPLRALQEERYVFVPHHADRSHPQYQGEEMTYGETVISPAYVRNRWSSLFELLDVHVPLTDMYQVTLTLRRRD